MRIVNTPTEQLPHIKIDVPGWLGNEGGARAVKGKVWRLDVQFRSEQGYLKAVSYLINEADEVLLTYC